MCETANYINLAGNSANRNRDLGARKRKGRMFRDQRQARKQLHKGAALKERESGGYTLVERPRNAEI
jgi:hypothetical protein